MLSLKVCPIRGRRASAEQQKKVLAAKVIQEFLVFTYPLNAGHIFHIDWSLLELLLVEVGIELVLHFVLYMCTCNTTKILGLLQQLL